ncbi:unnamed protein product [Hermetia illucens]|uniref:Galectin n=1 Tax=Hermetia illucens TaxID=343691 RepID=A0A7R8UG66_HERIL|nr:galectin-8-like isoform X1 [Hermetia illucens]CAD7080267.1 unnamed protein product [Hermetia illucens]
MAALIFVIGSLLEQLHRVAGVYINSGFSIRECREFIRETRRQLLFERYLEELKSLPDPSDNIVNNCDCSVRDSKTMGGYEDIEIIEGVEISESTFYEQIEPRVVFCNSNINELSEGVSFTITGKLVVNCERFSVNLVLNNPTRDVALHVNPRLPQNYIVRNCKIKNVWGTEEVTSALPFSLSRGSKFKMQILVTNTDYLISINGKHFASFRHRLPFNRVRIIEVKGDVENVSVDQDVVVKYPEILPTSAAIEIPRISDSKSLTSDYSKMDPSHSTFKEVESDYPVPFYGIFPDSLVDGKRLRIEGRVKILPHSFFINLQQGQQIWPHPTIAFHLNPRFANIGGKHVICRNSWIDGSWGHEERTEQQTDFMPGQHFTLTIVCTNSTYEVNLNRRIIAEYKHRVDPKVVDTIYIQGDIKLWDIALEDTPPAVLI